MSGPRGGRGAEPADTHPEVAALQHRLIMERSAFERAQMASDMATFARECALAGLRASGVTDPTELRIRLFLRLYGDDLAPAARDAVVARLRAEGEPQPGG